jgi:hypothetical protein
MIEKAFWKKNTAAICPRTITGRKNIKNLNHLIQMTSTICRKAGCGPVWSN